MPRWYSNNDSPRSRSRVQSSLTTRSSGDPQLMKTWLMSRLALRQFSTANDWRRNYLSSLIARTEDSWCIGRSNLSYPDVFQGCRRSREGLRLDSTVGFLKVRAGSAGAIAGIAVPHGHHNGRFVEPACVRRWRAAAPPWFASSEDADHGVRVETRSVFARHLWMKRSHNLGDLSSEITRKRLACLCGYPYGSRRSGSTAALDLNRSLKN
jgi:hypothetical protein